jgi:hypothetical protein
MNFTSLPSVSLSASNVIFQDAINAVEINQRVLQRIAAIAMFPDPLDFITKNPDCLFTKYKEIMDSYPKSLNDNLLNAFWTNYEWETPQYTCFITDKDYVTRKGFWIVWNDYVEDEKITSQIDATSKLLMLRYDILLMFFVPDVAAKIIKIISMQTEFGEKK